MATDGTRKYRLCTSLIAVIALAGCSAMDGPPAEKKRHPTPPEAAAALACSEDEIAICMDANCELEDYSCVDREAARRLFKAGENRY